MSISDTLPPLTLKIKQWWLIVPGGGGAKSARALLRFCIKRGKYILEGGEAKFARGVVGVDKKSIFARLDFSPTG